MELRLAINEGADAAGLSSLLAAHRQTQWRDSQGIEHTSEVAWLGPRLQSGFWHNLLEWVAQMEVSAVPASIAAGLITNYVWGLIQDGRRSREVVNDRANPKRPTSAPFDGLSGVAIVVRNNAKQVDIDPLSADHGTIEILVGSLFDGKYPDQRPDNQAP